MKRRIAWCRETDFNFVARLLEDSGIYWYFEHADGSQKLMLVDAATSHAPMPGETRLPYYENAGQVPPDPTLGAFGAAPVAVGAAVDAGSGVAAGEAV